MPDEIVITTTTDSPETLAAAMGGTVSLTPETPAEVPVETPAETPEAPAEGQPALRLAKGAATETPAATPPVVARTPAEEEAAQLRWQNHQLRYELEQARGTTPAVTAPAEAKLEPYAKAKPKIQDFPTIEDFTEAFGTWTAEKVKHEMQQEAAVERRRVEQAQQQQKQQEVQTSHVSRLEAFRKVTPDFDTVAQQARDSNVPMSPLTASFVQQSEFGPQVLYHLAKNPALATKIANLPRDVQLVALGEVQAEIRREDTERTRASGSKPAAPAGAPPVAAARPPKPIAPVGARPTTTTKRPDEMDYSEYKEYRANGGR